MPLDRLATFRRERLARVSGREIDELLPLALGSECPPGHDDGHDARDDEQRTGVGAEIPNRSPRNMADMRLGANGDVDAVGTDVNVLGAPMRWSKVAHDSE